jgi:hypothetical protein
METTLTINIPAPSARARVGGGGGEGEKEEKIKVQFKLLMALNASFSGFSMYRLILFRTKTSYYTPLSPSDNTYSTLF